MSASSQSSRPPLLLRIPAAVGAGCRALGRAALNSSAYAGGIVRLLGEVVGRTARAMVGRGDRMRVGSLFAQCFRFGVRSIPIVILVELFIGLILVLNLSPTLASYGQLERVADVVAIAILRELGPLLTAILLSGFAGASIAAEIGAMVEGEEIKALRAHALDPIRFLVVPRVIATTVMMVGLAVVADVAGILGGLFTAVFVLDLNVQHYLEFTRAAVGPSDYFTGLTKAAVFGMTIAALACYEGLRVRGGAEGVGRATTTTVVKCIVALIGVDSIFTAIFYVAGI